MKDRRSIEKTWAEVEQNTHNCFPMPRKEVYKKIEEWVSRVRGRLIGEKRRTVHRDVPLDYAMQQGITAMEATAFVETETVLVVEIPVRELESMAETEDWYKRNIQGFSMERFDKIIRQDQIEKSLREKHPGLEEAWEQYQIMLALCNDESFN